MDARRTRQRLANDLMPRIVGRIWSPGAVVTGSEDGHYWRANRRRDVHHAAVVGDDEAASPQQRRERLRSGRRRRQLRAWADLRGDAGRELLLVGVEAAQHERGQAAHLEK